MPPVATPSASSVSEFDAKQEHALRDADILPHDGHDVVPYPQPHKGRRKQLEEKYPQLKELTGKRIDSAVYVVLIVAVQTAITAAIGIYQPPWYVTLIAAYTIGAIANHMLWVLIHDLTHDAVFESSWWNKAFHCVANFPIFFPAAISFRYYHRLHHGFLNTAYEDPDLPGRLENKVFGTSPLGKALWLMFFAFIQILRTARFGPSLGGNEPWMVANWITQLSYNYVMYHFFGLHAIVYMFLGSMFSIGLHPLGTRWIAEHYSIKAPQETYSYYGSLNKIMFNIGYHNEHHDLPSIPWQNLPKVREIAPEFYQGLWYHTSYLRLLWHFLTDSRFTLETRTVRLPKADTPYMKKDRKPDADKDYEKSDDEAAPSFSSSSKPKEAKAVVGVTAEVGEPAAPPTSSSSGMRKRHSQRQLA